MDPFIGEIRLFGGTYAPEGWLLCDGSTQSVASYQALFALIGTTYGGNGASTFNLPNLNGNLPVGQGQGTGLSQRVMGQAFGTSQVTLNTATMPTHQHAIQGTQNPATQSAPSPALMLGTLPPPPATTTFYDAGTATTHKPFSPQALQNQGGSQAHDNQMPSIAINYIIAWQGIYPVQG